MHVQCPPAVAQAWADTARHAHIQKVWLCMGEDMQRQQAALPLQAVGSGSSRRNCPKNPEKSMHAVNNRQARSFLAGRLP
eukprot:361313-Chlamydomonas_euryale.AAC.4